MRSSFHVLGCTLLGAALAAACGDNHAAPDAAPPDAAPDAGFPASTAIPLLSPDGSFYTAMVNVGTQTFAMDVDTGSTTIGVAETACTTCTGVTPLYTPGATAVVAAGTVDAEYGDGSTWSGPIYSDQLGLGNGTPDVLVSFAAISKQDSFFDGGSYQGILGLGPSDLLEDGTTSYLVQAKAAGAPTKLGFELCQSTGSMWLGDVDASKASAPMSYTPMLPISRNNGFYSVEVDDLMVGSASLGLTANSFQSPIVDTGTSLFYLPTAVMTSLTTALTADPGVVALFGATGFAAGHHGACASGTGVTDDQVAAMLPTISLKMPDGNGGSILVALPPSQYLEDFGNGRFCLAIQGSNDGAILGDTFLQSFVTVIDPANAKIGFAPDAGCATTDPTSSTSSFVHRTGDGPVEHGHPHFRQASLNKQ